jgi:multiple sugar transport system substrate-binding protein
MKVKGLVSKGLVLMFIAALIFITACGNNNAANNKPAAPDKTNDSKEPAAPTNEAKKLSIMWWGPDARHEATLKALDVYTAQNPSVTFTPEYLAWDPFWAKLPTLAASKTMTDILQMDAAFINEYVSRGTLEDLSDIDLTGIVDPKIIENLKIDGKLYGIPLSHNAQGFAYNKTALEAAGVTLPKLGWTWDDYFAFAREARSKLPKDQFGIGYTDTWDGYQYYQTANGKGPMMQDGGKTFNLDKDLFMKFYNEHEALRKEGALPPADMQAAFLENDAQADPMASGKIMLTGKSVGSVSALELLLPGQVEVVNVPVGSAGGGWAQSTIFLAVSTDSKNKEEAKKFVKWFITDPEAGKTLGLTRGIPINNEVYKALEPNLEPKDILGKKLAEAAAPYALPFYAPAAGYSEFIDFFKNEMDAVMFGQKSVADAYESINKKGMDTAATIK